MSESNSNSGALRQSLSKLHDELARSATVDEGTRKLLSDVLADIERLLHGGAGSAVAMPARPAAQSRLESLAVEFEADHPSLAASLRQFVDLLGRAGV